MPNNQLHADAQNYAVLWFRYATLYYTNRSCIAAGELGVMQGRVASGALF